MLKKNPNLIKRVTIFNLFKRVLFYTIAVIAGYLIVGYFLHMVVFPENEPKISTYFEPGQVFYSKAEGFRQTVVKQGNGLVLCSLEIEPYAPGPPKHIHADFDEFFGIENGELSVWVDGEVKRIRPGDKLHIPKGTPHQPYNETPDTIRLKGVMPFPEEFAFSLVQLYGLMDNNPDFGKLPKTLFMLAPIQQDGGFDSYLAEGPPIFIQKLTSFFLTPVARLMGYRSYYKEHDIPIKR